MTRATSTTQRLERSTIRHNLSQFVVRWRERIAAWRETNESGTEQKYAQQYWTDFFSCFGINATYLNVFEQTAKRSSTGGHGRIDFFMPNKLIGEAKSLDVDLDAAHQQALDYLRGGTIKEHQWPRYIMCTNFEQIRLNRLGEQDERFDVTISLDELLDHAEKFMFLAGYESVSHREQERASIAASEIMANLFRALNDDDVDEAVGDAAPTNPEDEDERVEQTSMYLTRLLFLLFGDNAGLWQPGLFADLVINANGVGELSGDLNTLFNDVLNKPESQRPRRLPEHLAKFPYVNGGLFAGDVPKEYFDEQMHQVLVDACSFDWSQISPAIFGSLFQLVKSKEARRHSGEHYTSEKNILKTIEPLFLDELRAEARRLINSKSTSVKKLREFRDSLANNIYCDPACGSGNFLIVAYRELRKIETEMIVAIREREGSAGSMTFDISWEQKLSIDQFYGFEINWWPAKIAETAMFLVDHQANRELADAIGLAPERLPINITAHIHHGNALQLDWAEILPETSGQTYIFGNPPFIGHQTKTKSQRADLKAVWKDDFDGYLDYVTGWHAQTLSILQHRRGEFAYVTTNSITQGQPVPALFGPIFRDHWRIKFAHRTFSWDSEAPGKAAVHCVIVGFTRNTDVKPRLWDYPDVRGEAVPVPVEKSINAYLVDGPNVLVSRQTKSLTGLPKASFGTMPIDGGNLIVEVDDYADVANDKIAARYLRPFRMGRELVRGLDRWCLWMAEGFDPADVNRSSILKTRIQACKEYRENAPTGGDAYKYKDTPHLMRPNKNRPTKPYVGIPRVVSENRKYYTVQHLSPEVIAGDKVYTATDPEGLLFALISSSMFISWQRTVGGRLKSDLNFAGTLTWNTFPVPELDSTSKKQIITAGKKVLEARELHPERSLADHYNPLAMDPALLKAHDALDKEVDKAFGAPRKLTNERQRQELLFENYSKLTS
ncbi:N-6 DNA methylase [Corynebacterium pseudodiphtheriticum]|uniref:DNA methyltransferase n=1 Tax=Corynebacterium pseudodiphtheriticum TaxID=37637 RepID=UPI002542F706|nr:DNA methyltransferase [Corynebacterium pseudodiphtheriticum]MDK4328816.1 N-6 DNA methylase [Corynebacterium pseudodiphtheriticum]